jgi:hypothetical protein
LKTASTLDFKKLTLLNSPPNIILYFVPVYFLSIAVFSPQTSDSMIDISRFKRSRLAAKHNSFFLVGFMFCMVAVVGAQFLFANLMVNSSGAGSSGPTSSTLFLAPADDFENSTLYSAITLDPAIEVSTTYSGNFSDYDCVVLDAGYPGINTIANDLITYVKNGGGLLLVSSPELTANSSFLVDLEILIAPIAHENTKLATIDQPAGNDGHPLSRKIEWNSMPEIARYTNLSSSNTNASGNINSTGTTILLDRYVFIEEGAASDDALLIDKELGNGHVLYFAGYLGNPKDNNYQVKVWPYFNYMFYVSIQYVVNPVGEVVSYGTWAYSPVPHFTEQVIIGVYVCAMLVLAVTLFSIVKRVSARTRLDQVSIEAAKVKIVKEESSSLISCLLEKKPARSRPKSQKSPTWIFQTGGNKLEVINKSAASCLASSWASSS